MFGLWSMSENKGRKQPIWLSGMIALVLDLYSLPFPSPILPLPPASTHTHVYLMQGKHSQLSVFLRETEKKKGTNFQHVFVPLYKPKFVESVDWNYCHSSLPYGIISYSSIYLTKSIVCLFVLWAKVWLLECQIAFALKKTKAKQNKN